MTRSASPSRTAHAVVRRIDALERHATDLQARRMHQRDRAELQDAVLALTEARAWLRAAAPAEAVLVAHVAQMVGAASTRLYTVSRQIG